jgi:rhodanese-related sulfurtransferase
MLGTKRGGTTQPWGAGEYVSTFSVLDAVNCLYYISITAFITFSTLAVAASTEATGKPSSGVAPAHSKTFLKKQDVSCDSPGAAENQSTAQEKLRNRSCLLSLSAADKLRTQKNFSFVDVRSSAEFDRYRIADSINIPLHLVKTKEFLKKLPVVLVNDGRSTTELEKTCGELKLAGFERVSVLEGGLFAWSADKRKLEGDPVEQSKINRMTAGELFEERSKPNWTVIDVSTQKKDKEIISWLPAKVIAVPFNPKVKGDSISRISAAIAQQRKKNPQGKLLLIADDDNVYEQIDARLSKSGVVASNILRLDGGIKGYREQVKNQLAVWNQQNQQNQPRRYQACRG